MITTAAAARADGPVRLTRRGRLVGFVMVLTAVLALFVLFGGPALSTDTAHHPATRTVVVQPGDTLWDIALRVDRGADPRDVVAQIAQMNSLDGDGGTIRVGQPLLVPRR